MSDPVPRRAEGRIIMPGHVGTIYQASNAVYTGRATRRTLTMLPDGTVLNDRAQSKVRNLERGYAHVARKLYVLGARQLEVGEDPAAWLAEAVAAVGARRIRHAGNHRYAFAIGRTRNERNRVRIALPGAPYPKRPDLEAA